MPTIRARFRPHPRGFGFLTPVGDDGLTERPVRIDDDPTSYDSAFVPPPVASGLLADDLVEAEVAADDKGLSATAVRVVERARRMVVGRVQQGPGAIVIEPDPGIGSGWLALAPSVQDALRGAVGRLAVVLVGEDDAGVAQGRALVAGPFVVGSPQAAHASAVVKALGAAAPELVPGGPEAVGIPLAEAVATHTRVVGMFAGGGRGAATGLDTEGPVPGADLEATDRRGEMALTIDDASARDLDDAVTIGWDGSPDSPMLVVVHIADASAAVGVDSDADRYARTVASSAYFTHGPSAPMLDPDLSEDLLSLLPGVDRSVLSVRFVLQPDGSVTGTTLEFAWITSRAKLSYASVEAWLGGDASGIQAEAAPNLVPHVETTLRGVVEAARRLGAQRDDRDTMESLFDPVELEPGVVDGRLRAVDAEPHADAYRLVERLMVAANEGVAGWMVERGVPALYRAHVGVDPERASRLRAACAHVGAEVPALGTGEEDADQDAVIGQILAEVDRLATEGRTADRDLVVAAVTGATARATYDPDPAHHRGLAAAAYCHFTSPIRRYADLVVHRQVRAALAGEAPLYTAADLARMAPWLDARSGALSRAQAFERGDLWSLLLDRGYLDAPEPAVITGLSANGIRIRLPRLGLTGFVTAERALGLPPRERGKLIVDEHGLQTSSGPWQLGAHVKVRFVTLDDTGRPVFRLGDGG